jgi:hypothetical protein
MSIAPFLRDPKGLNNLSDFFVNSSTKRFWNAPVAKILLVKVS